jgi:hypothetical protein
MAELKRVPKSKSGRLLVAIRNKIIGDAKNGSLERSKLWVIENLDRRIEGRLKRQDLKTHVQLMMSDYRTVVQYKNPFTGKNITAKYVGSIEEAKTSLKVFHGVKNILWAHFTKNNEMLIQGMWIEMNVY